MPLVSIDRIPGGQSQTRQVEVQISTGRLGQPPRLVVGDQGGHRLHGAPLVGADSTRWAALEPSGDVDTGVLADSAKDIRHDRPVGVDGAPGNWGRADAERSDKG